MLEAAQYKDNAFVTLTYDDENLPKDGSLDPSHLKKFLYKLRSQYERRTRYYACGEYGEQSGRPHYHLALFNYPSCFRGGTSRNRNGSCCLPCDTLQQMWKMGRIFNGTLSTESAAYTAQYVTKKLTSPDDERLAGKHPEFARMSLRPGIGAGMMDELASTLMEHGIEKPPTMLMHGRNKWPLGKYLRKNLKAKMGYVETYEELEKQKEELSPLREAAYASAPRGQKDFAFKQAIIDSNQGKRINVEARHARKRKKDKL